MLRKSICFVLALCLLLCALPAVHASVGLEYEYDASTGHLRIYGTGAIPDYESPLPWYNDIISPWYSIRDTLKSVVIEEGVTAIGNYTFYDCGKLESITLPESLERIGDFAFQSCKSLKNVKLPSNLYEIGLTAFSSCSSLESIEIPESVGARLGANAFMYCRSLKLAKLPGSADIPDRVLYGCSSLICLSMSPGYTIGDYAFGGCVALSHVLYSGTKAQWNRTCASDEDLSLAFVHFKVNGDEVYIRDDGTLYCTICQEILKPRCNHKNKASWDRIEATCTEDGWTSGEYCTDCGEVLTAREVLPAYGHSFYAYTNNGDGSHTAFCYNCGEGLVEKHTFVETNCICGAADPVIDESITIGEVLALENDLTMKFRVNPEQLENYVLSSLCLVVERDIYSSDGTKRVEEKVLRNYTASGGKLVFSYSGIAAAQMNDEIRVILRIKDAAGREYASLTKVTSITAYANSLLKAMPAGQVKLYRLIMDMLNYGTAAQLYFNRHTDAPANTAYPRFANYAHYASADLTTSLQDLSSRYPNEGATATVSQTLDLGTRIGITYKVRLPENVDRKNVELVISDGSSVEYVSLKNAAVDSKGRCVVNYYGNAARDIRKIVYATVYAGDVAISDTYAYSISSYVCSIQQNAAAVDPKLVTVAQMLIFYGDSAAAYFG